MSHPDEPRCFASPPHDGFAFVTSALTCLGPVIGADAQFPETRPAAWTAPRTTEGGPCGPPSEKRLAVGCLAYQKLPCESAADLQPPAGAPVQVRVEMPVVGLFEIVNVFVDFDVATTL